jgi:putative acetyltransferase
MNSLSISIRKESPEDIPAIFAVNAAAFGRELEGKLVDQLRAAGHVVLSLVAIEEERLVGQITFCPVTIDNEGIIKAAIALGTVAVQPEFQKQGVGSRLIEAGLAEVKAMDYDLVIVLGHASYYPRFGFAPASRFDIRWEHAAPDEAFMVKELCEGALASTKGVVKYGPEFEAAIRDAAPE